MERLERMVVHLLGVGGSWAVRISVSSRLRVLSVVVVWLVGGVVVDDQAVGSCDVGVDVGWW